MCSGRRGRRSGGRAAGSAMLGPSQPNLDHDMQPITAPSSAAGRGRLENRPRFQQLPGLGRRRRRERDRGRQDRRQRRRGAQRALSGPAYPPAAAGAIGRRAVADLRILRPASLPVTDFQATLRITPVVDGDRAFVEWWATFDCEAAVAMSSPRPCAAGSRNGSNRCATTMRDGPVPAAPAELAVQVPADSAAFRPDIGRSAAGSAVLGCCIRGPHLA